MKEAEFKRLVDTPPERLRIIVGQYRNTLALLQQTEVKLNKLEEERQRLTGAVQALAIALAEASGENTVQERSEPHADALLRRILKRIGNLWRPGR